MAAATEARIQRMTLRAILSAATPNDVLGLDAAAPPPAEVERAYRELSRGFHPDKVRGGPISADEATAAMKQLNRARDALLGRAPWAEDEPPPPPPPPRQRRRPAAPKRNRNEWGGDEWVAPDDPGCESSDEEPKPKKRKAPGKSPKKSPKKERQLDPRPDLAPRTRVRVVCQAGAGAPLEHQLAQVVEVTDPFRPKKYSIQLNNGQVVHNIKADSLTVRVDRAPPPPPHVTFPYCVTDVLCRLNYKAEFDGGMTVVFALVDHPINLVKTVVLYDHEGTCDDAMAGCFYLVSATLHGTKEYRGVLQLQANEPKFSWRPALAADPKRLKKKKPAPPSPAPKRAPSSPAPKSPAATPCTPLSPEQKARAEANRKAAMERRRQREAEKAAAAARRGADAPATPTPTTPPPAASPAAAPPAAAAPRPDVDSMSIKDLRALIRKAGLSCIDCVEKHEIKARARAAQARLAEAARLGG